MEEILTQYTYHSPLEVEVVLDSRAQRRKVVKAALVREAVDKFISDYNPQDPDKIKQWSPERRPEGMPMRSVYLYPSQYTALTNIAEKQGNILGKELNASDAIRSAVVEYLGIIPR